MTVDERIERLTARHEALTESVELMGHRMEEQGRTIDKILVAIRQDAENIRALARIPEAHEHRIEDLEAGH